MNLSGASPPNGYRWNLPIQPSEIVGPSGTSVENGVLTIAGQRSKAQNEEHEGMRRVERIGGPFYRRFSLPDTANADDISATSRDGILEVSIPKRALVLPRKITVEAA